MGAVTDRPQVTNEPQAGQSRQTQGETEGAEIPRRAASSASERAHRRCAHGAVRRCPAGVCG